MFYLIKFLESLVQLPGIFIVLFLIIGLTLFHHHRLAAVLVILVTALLYASSTSVVAYALIRPLEHWYSPPKNLQGDVIVILGGGATFGTPAVNGTGNLTGDGANRLLTTAMLYKKTGLPILLTSGPMRGNTSQSLIAKQELVALGIPSNKIVTENKSLNTLQNAEFSKRIMKQQGYTHPILVTSAYHMRRAVLEFSKAGVNVIPYPCGYHADTTGSMHYDSVLPSTASLTTTETAIHEYLGILALKLGVPA